MRQSSVYIHFNIYLLVCPFYFFNLVEREVRFGDKIAKGLHSLNRLCQKAAEHQLQGEQAKRCIDVFQAVGMKSSKGTNIGSGSSGFLGKYCAEQQTLVCIY